MIDVWGVIANSLWVLGLAALLATLSWTHWVASMGKIRFRTVLRRPSIRWALDLGLVLFCAGLAATSGTWWERALWGLLAAAWMVQAWLAGRSKANGREGNGSD